MISQRAYEGNRKLKEKLASSRQHPRQHLTGDNGNVTVQQGETNLGDLNPTFENQKRPFC